MQRTEQTRVLHHSSLGLHCRGCPNQISYSAGFLKGSGWRSRDEAMATKTTFHGLLRSRHCHGRWSSWPWPRPVSSSQNPSTPPKKIPWGIRSTPGLDTETGHTRTQQSTGQDRLYRTTNPQEQEALLGRARKLRSLQGMTWSQGPSPGCLRNRFQFNDRRGPRRALDESPWTRHDQH